MPKEKSAGAVIFHKGEQIEYLLLLYPGSGKKSKQYWDLAKGHIEEKETEEDTLKREVFEETGLKDISIIDGFKKSIRYFFQKDGKTISKTVVFYLVKAKHREIKISPEHLDYVWLPIKDAIQTITHQDAKKILRAGNQFLYQKKNKP